MVWIEVLKHHPLKALFTKKYQVPEEYLQQWWYYIEYLSETQEISSHINGYRFVITSSDIQNIFDLPHRDSVEGKEDFDSVPRTSALIQDFIHLGYSENFTALSAFKRKCLPPIWYTLFSIINTCLSGKTSSLDQASNNIKLIFHGICFNKHYDYASLIFDELILAVTKKSTYPYIPFQRFMQIFIKGAMRAASDIPSLDDQVYVPLFSMDSLRPPSSKIVFENTLPISGEVRALVPPRNQVLRNYCISMGLPEPDIPAQDTPEGEMQVVRSVGERGEEVHGGEQPQRAKRKNQSVRSGRNVRQRTERSTQEKVLTTCDPNLNSRAATQSITPHSLVGNIERTSEPMVQVANPSSHSSSSQKEDVSITHLGHAAHKPSGIHMDEPDVETEGYMSPLHTENEHIESGFATTFEPKQAQDAFLSHPSTSLRDLPKQLDIPVVRTSIDDPDSGLQGLDGSPGRVNITQALLTESLILDVVTSTGPPSSERVITEPLVGSGLLPPSSEFQQLKDFCTSEFAKIQKSIQELTDTTKREMEDRVAIEREEREKRLSELQKASATSETLSEFQEALKKSFSEVVSTISNFGASSSSHSAQPLNTPTMATKDDIQLVLTKLSSIEQKQEEFDVRLRAQECRTQEILKRRHDDQDPDDHVGEKRQRISEPETGGLGKISEGIATEEQIPEKDSEVVKETETSELMIVASQSSEGEEIPVVDMNEGYEVDEGYETDQLEEIMSEDDVTSNDTEKVQDSDEDMVNEYLANEEVIGEPGDLSDVIVFDEENMESSESDEEVVIMENNIRDIVVWNPVNMAEIARIFNEGVLKLWKWFQNLLILNFGLVNSTWNLECRFMFEKLSVFENFYNQPTLEDDVEPDFSHMEVDYDDEDFTKFFQVRSVRYKASIKIPRIELPILEEPMLDQVFTKDVLFSKEDVEETVFPEDKYSTMYRKSLKFASLESFLDDQWSEDFRNKVQSFYQKYGVQDLNDSTPIAKFLSVSRHMEHGLEIIRFGAERRDQSLVEFTQYDIYNLRLQDKLSLLTYASQIGDSEIVTEVKRIMGIYIRNLIKHDFQLGLERRLNKVNLLERTEISSIIVNKVFTHPELGCEYRTCLESHVGCRVFLVSDISKYSTSTLNWILKELDNIGGSQELKAEISFLIKEKIHFRQLIRRSYTSGHPRVNSIREADYLLSNCYDFNVHVKDQKIQFEVLDVPELSQVQALVGSEEERKGKDILIEKEQGHSESDSKRMLSEMESLHSQRIEEHAFTLFLEYLHPEMFMESEQRFNFIDCWFNKSSIWKVRYSKFVQATKKSLDLIRSDKKIVKVLDADIKTKLNFKYASFKIQREGGEVCVFSEADFHNMELKDLLRVYKSLYPFADKIAKFRKTFPILRDGLFREFIWATKTDFQVAYILKKEKVNLIRPNFHMTGIEGMKPGTLMINPPGLVGQIDENKVFIRLSEIHKCCNGTLLKVKRKVEKRIRKRPRRLSENDWSSYKKLGKSFIQNIDKQLEYRSLILEDVFQILTEWKYDLSF